MQAIETNHTALLPRNSNSMTVNVHHHHDRSTSGVSVASSVEASADVSKAPETTVASSTSLVDALRVVTQLAAMDSDEYQSTVLRRSPRHDGNSDSSTSSGGVPNKQPSWDDESARVTKQQQQQGERTEAAATDSVAELVEALTRHVHRLQSAQLLLQNESDSQAAEIQALQHCLVQAQDDQRVLSNKNQSLQSTNAKLRSKLRHVRQERAVLVQHVRHCQDTLESAHVQAERFQTLKQAYLLQRHEKQLINNRSRTASADSVSSHVSLDGLDGFGNMPQSQLSVMTTGDQHGGAIVAGEEASDSSISTLITDDGIATLKLSLQAYDSPIASALSNTNTGSFAAADAFSPCVNGPPTAGSEPPACYTLTFRRGTKVGILIRALELPDEAQLIKQHAAEHAKKKQQLKKQTPHSDLTKALMQDAADDEENDKTAHGKNSNNNKPAPFSLKFNMNPFHNNNNKSADGDEASSSQQRAEQPQHGADSSHHAQHAQRYAHIVSGYNDFDTTQNATPPALGARIVAINHVAVPETFTLSELLTSLQANSDSSMLDDTGHAHDDDEEDETYTVTFRNDPLTAAQKQTLHLPVDDEKKERSEAVGGEQERDSGDEEEGKGMSSSKQQHNNNGGFHFGFIRLGGESNHSTNHNNGGGSNLLSNRVRTWSSSSSSQKSAGAKESEVPSSLLPAADEEEDSTTTGTGTSGGNDDSDSTTQAANDAQGVADEDGDSTKPESEPEATVPDACDNEKEEEPIAADDAGASTEHKETKPEKKSTTKPAGSGGFNFGFIRLGQGESNRSRTWSSSSKASTVAPSPKEEENHQAEETVALSPVPAQNEEQDTATPAGNAHGDDGDTSAKNENAAANTSVTSTKTNNPAGDITRTAVDVLQFWKPAAARQQHQLTEEDEKDLSLI